MFIDETVITAVAGDGGNGCHAYERLKYKPKGRPDGGCGGRGGHVSVEGSFQLHTLQDAAYRHTYRAERGAHGKGSNNDGANGADVTIHVPLGTIVSDDETGEILADCLEDGKSVIVARGGRGGRGNAALRSPRNPNPEKCEAGKPGEKRKLRCVLKVLADIGLVGRPNAGKSTFLARISRARPKIAEYPFTTLEPHLGIASVPGRRSSFVVADIPGLIEGSHTGKGLGIRFLRHIERTRVLAILVESTCADPRAEADLLVSELTHYSPLLAAKPACLICTKSDLLTKDAPSLPPGWLAMSAVTGEGVDTVLRRLAKLLDEEAIPEAVSAVS